MTIFCTITSYPNISLDFTSYIQLSLPFLDAANEWFLNIDKGNINAVIAFSDLTKAFK